MLAPALCLVAFLISYRMGKRSLGNGLVAVLVFGYAYGIVRANLLTSWSHFIFDASLLGLYLSQNWTSADAREARRLRSLRIWFVVLVGWCLLVAVLPFQPLLVSMVGLRGNIFFLPVLLLGAKLRSKDLTQLCTGMAVLNLVAVAFACAEYFLGVPRFYPFSPVTQIIYSSTDAGAGNFRIPAIFSSAHAYGAAMVCSLPFLIGGWDRTRQAAGRILFLSGIAAVLLGVLLSATRLNFVLGSAMVGAAILTSRISSSKRIVFALLIVLAGVAAMSNERFQRFKTLKDTEAVTDRVAGSVNRGFWEILVEYPLGNGLGGGGTSIPYFLQGQVRNPIGLENEYSRILCEQGIIGLLLWIGFILWFLARGNIAFARGRWVNGRRMAFCLAAVLLSTAWIGIGLLTAIPSTVLLLLAIGWTALPEIDETRQVSGTSRAFRPHVPSPRLRPQPAAR